MGDAAIRESQYEKGLFFVQPEPGTTLQSIGLTEWKVGERYALEKVLGYGSYSCVCLATDRVNGERVALKRIGNVLQSPEHAKRVLRELAIMRRVAHPSIISVRNCFVRPSTTGECRMVGGKLVNLSIDLYIAMEYGEGGDIFHMKGQLSGQEVKSLLWQLLQAIKYLHSMHVWHRDVKSQNVFFTWERGARVVKLGDFGSSRSATLGEESLPGAAAGGAAMHSAHSFKEMDAAMLTADLYLQCEEEEPAPAPAPPVHGGTSASAPASMGRFTSGGGGTRGFKPPLTRVVATPCYRAPEVVMSRGGYTEAIDMWSVGCVFGELLQRVAYVGSADTPQLSVAPLFAIRGMPKTPDGAETFGRPECAGTRRELSALFDVVGTPSWSDAAAVPVEEWRHYLAKLPGKAPTLHRRFRAAGEVAVHLLSRLLEFDPSRRIGCEEALAHEFFADLRGQLQAAVEEAAAAEESASAKAWELLAKQPSLAIDFVAAAATQGALSAEAASPEKKAPPAVPAAAARGVDCGGDGVAVLEQGQHHYWEEANPGRALAMLEDELDDIAADPDVSPASESCQRLRRLLEKECAALQAARSATAEGGGKTAAGTVPGEARPFTEMLLRGGAGLQEDRGGVPPKGGAANDLGCDRLSNVADTWQGRELDPRKFLGPKRHGEWTTSGGGGGPAPGPRWGVTAAPPGLHDPRLEEIIRKQQGR